jgi:hypothetical protein
MDTSIHFSELVGLLAVCGGIGAFVWLLRDMLRKHTPLRRNRP